MRPCTVILLLATSNCFSAPVWGSDLHWTSSRREKCRHRLIRPIRSNKRDSANCPSVHHHLLRLRSSPRNSQSLCAHVYELHWFIHSLAVVLLLLDPCHCTLSAVDERQMLKGLFCSLRPRSFSFVSKVGWVLFTHLISFAAVETSVAAAFTATSDGQPVRSCIFQ